MLNGDLGNASQRGHEEGEQVFSYTVPGPPVIINNPKVSRSFLLGLFASCSTRITLSCIYPFSAAGWRPLSGDSISWTWKSSKPRTVTGMVNGCVGFSVGHGVLDGLRGGQCNERYRLGRRACRGLRSDLQNATSCLDGELLPS